jgi:hypothetical protein
MAINPIYREEWVKPNMWRVRAEFIAGGGEPAKYGDRSVTTIQGAFKEVAGHKASFTESIPFGAADGESCKFVVDYTAIPLGMQGAITAQNAAVDNAYFATATSGKYRTPKYMPQSIYSSKPQQPNLFMVWSDRGTSNGIPTAISLGGQVGTLTDGTFTNVDAKPYLPNPMDTRNGVGLKVTYTVTAGVVTAVSIGSTAGTGFQVGDEVYVGNLATTFAYFTITSVQSSTWYPEFIGCQRLSPSTKYSAQVRGLEIEIEAIGLHKICLEAISDLTTFSRQYVGTLTDDSGTSEVNAVRVASINIWDYSYRYNGWGRSMRSGSGLMHWHAPLGSIFGYLDAAFDEAFEFYSMEGYQSTTTSSTNLAGVYPATGSKLKLLQAAFSSDTITNVQLGQSSGDLHGSAEEMSKIRFIFAVTERFSNTAYSDPNLWVAGLFTDDENGIKKDCDSAWDLFKKMCEQFFLKMTPYYEISSGLLKAKWNMSDPYGTVDTATSITYLDTASESSFEVNAGTIESVKLHYVVSGDDIDTSEVTSFTKSGKKIEINNIFDIRVRTSAEGYLFPTEYGFGYVNQKILAPYANLRGLFFASDATVNFFGSVQGTSLIAICPRVTIEYTTGSTTTVVDAGNRYYYTTDTSIPNYLFYEQKAITTLDAVNVALQDLQANKYNGFGPHAVVLSAMYGVPLDPADGVNANSVYASNNQTLYEMTRPLSTDVLPKMIGQRIDITPHTALTGAVSPKAYLVDVEIDWTARDANSDYVNAKYLTRSIGFN